MDENSGFPQAGPRRKLTITLDDLEPAAGQSAESAALAAASPDSVAVTLGRTAAGPSTSPLVHRAGAADPPTIAMSPAPVAARPVAGPSPPAPAAPRPLAPAPAPVAAPPVPPARHHGGRSPQPIALLHERAGFWKRFWALWLDGVILCIPLGIVMVLFFYLFGIIGLLLAPFAQIGYFTYFEGRPRGQTPGKAALGIRVVSRTTGGPISHGTAFGRQWARVLSGLAFDLGYLWMLWDPERQTWHDKLADTLVVPVGFDRG